MRAFVLHTLALMLIAIFAIGAPQPATADCVKCRDCSTEAPTKSDIPCPEKGLACQVAQTCGSQVQKAPAPINGINLAAANDASFGRDVTMTIKAVDRRPDTAPPRA